MLQPLFSVLWLAEEIAFNKACFPFDEEQVRCYSPVIWCKCPLTVDLRYGEGLHIFLLFLLFFMSAHMVLVPLSPAKEKYAWLKTSKNFVKLFWIPMECQIGSFFFLMNCARDRPFWEAEGEKLSSSLIGRWRKFIFCYRHSSWYRNCEWILQVSHQITVFQCFWKLFM